MKNNQYIFTGFAPNLTKKDVSTSLSFLFNSKKWFSLKNGEYLVNVEQYLKEYLSVKNIFLVDSGRSALFLALRTLGIGYGDEVLVQAYTCVVVVNAISFTGAKPVYVDIDDDFNLDVNDLRKKINKNTKAVIVQHTFGIPANLNEISGIAKETGIKLIEDCAHSLGASYNDKKIGTFGDLSIFSFGSDKVVSCNRGGAIVVNDDVLAEKTKVLFDRLPMPITLKIIQYLLHFPIFFIGKKFYDIKIGKAILYIAKKIHLINRVIYEPEKKGRRMLFYPAKLPNCLAKILFDQLRNLEEKNEHRFEIANFYVENIKNQNIIPVRLNKDAVYLRFTILVEHPQILFNFALKNKIILGDWYNTVVAPKDVDMLITEYQEGSCPNAEKLASMSVNLPTDQNIDLEKARKIVDLINETQSYDNKRDTE